MMDDHALEDIRNQGQKGFLILYKRYVKSLCYHVLCKYHIPKDSVDEVLQEIFLKFFQNIESFSSDCRISTWLNQIATSVVSDYWRKNAKEDHSVECDRNFM